MAQTRSGSVKNSKLSVLLLGYYGTYKSEKALETLLLKRDDGKPFRVMYFDAENGSMDDRLSRFQDEYDVNLQNLFIVYTQSTVEVLKYIDAVKKNEDIYGMDENGDFTDELVLDADNLPFKPDVVVIDGMAILTQSKKLSLEESSKIRAKLRVAEKKQTGLKALVTVEDAGMEFKDFNKLNSEGVKIILALTGCGKHFVVTSFAKDEMEEVATGELDDFGKPKKVKTGKLTPDAFKGLIEYCKTVICLTRNDDIEDIRYRYNAMVQNKDRTETFEPNQNIERFSVTMFQSIISKGNSIVVRDNFDSNIEKDAKADIYDKNKNPFDTEPVKVEKPKAKLEIVNNEEDEKLIKELQKKCSDILNSGDIENKKKLITKLKQAKCTTAVSAVNDVETLEKYLKVLTS